MKSISGLKRIGYSVSPISEVEWLPSKLSPESSINPEVTATDISDGAVTGGSSVQPVFTVYGRGAFDTLEQLSDDDTEVYWHLEYFDGRHYISRVPFNVMLSDPLNASMRDGVSAIVITGQKWHVRSNVF
jgi:hypothetical protein